MIETIVVWIIILCCLYYILKRFYSRWKAARDNATVSCLDGCSCCSDSSCKDRVS